MAPPGMIFGMTAELVPVSPKRQNLDAAPDIFRGIVQQALATQQFRIDCFGNADL
jgi:hypothetical protein